MLWNLYLKFTMQNRIVSLVRLKCKIYPPFRSSIRSKDFNRYLILKAINLVKCLFHFVYSCLEVRKKHFFLQFLQPIRILAHDSNENLAAMSGASELSNPPSRRNSVGAQDYSQVSSNIEHFKVINILFIVG